MQETNNRNGGKGCRPLENSLRTKQNPEFVNVFLTMNGVILLNFHFKYFCPTGNVNGTSELWVLNIIYGGTWGNKLSLTGQLGLLSPAPVAAAKDI